MLNQQILGIVLCGGKSVRMKRDKAFIQYHTLPQFAHVAHMLKSVCQNTIVSCNVNQFNKISQTEKALTDNATIIDIGPMRGLLTAFNAYPAMHYLVVGCDYPELTLTDIKALILAKTQSDDAVCLGNTTSNFKEPMLALYDNRCADLLWDFYYESQFSLQQFLNKINTRVIFPANPNHIVSINS